MIADELDPATMRSYTTYLRRERPWLSFIAYCVEYIERLLGVEIPLQRYISRLVYSTHQVYFGSLGLSSTCREFRDCLRSRGRLVSLRSVNIYRSVLAELKRCHPPIEMDWGLTTREYGAHTYTYDWDRVVSVHDYGALTYMYDRELDELTAERHCGKCFLITKIRKGSGNRRDKCRVEAVFDSDWRSHRIYAGGVTRCKHSQGIAGKSFHSLCVELHEAKKIKALRGIMQYL